MINTAAESSGLSLNSYFCCLGYFDLLHCAELTEQTKYVHFGIKPFIPTEVLEDLRQQRVTLVIFPGHRARRMGALFCLLVFFKVEAAISVLLL